MVARTVLPTFNQMVAPGNAAAPSEPSFVSAANALAAAVGNATHVQTNTATGTMPGLALGAAGSAAEFVSGSASPHGVFATSDVLTSAGNLNTYYSSGLNIGFSSGPVSADLAYSIAFGASHYLL